MREKPHHALNHLEHLPIGHSRCSTKAIAHTGQIIDFQFIIYILSIQGRQIPGLYALAHVAGWEPYSLHDLRGTYFLDWICIVQIPYNISLRQAWI